MTVARVRPLLGNVSLKTTDSGYCPFLCIEHFKTAVYVYQELVIIIYTSMRRQIMNFRYKRAFQNACFWTSYGPLTKAPLQGGLASKKPPIYIQKFDLISIFPYNRSLRGLPMNGGLSCRLS